VEKLFRDLEIRLIASVMERNQYLVRKTPAIARRGARAGFPTRIVFSLAHGHP
jgi:hypothetical protein